MQKKIERSLWLLILMLGISFFNLSASSQTKVTLALKNATLNDFFKGVEEQTGYTIMYNNVNLHQQVDVQAKDDNLDNVLTTVLSSLDLTYKIVGKRIILNPKKETQSSGTKQREAPKRKITGVVLDESGESVIGASVVEKGTTNGVITDVDGKFELNISAGAQIVITSIGFQEITVNIENQNFVDIILKESSVSLDEVVVLGFGQTQKKIAQTGSLAQITNKELMQSPVSNVTNALAGRLPGLITIQKSGEPGRDASSLYIRGVGTLNSTAPLITIDGVQKNSEALNILDPNEIENITILKDASATALYGVKGANGVVIITTKRGKEGKPQINVRTQFAVQNPTRIPRFLRSFDFAKLYNEAYFNENPTHSLSDAPYSNEALEAYRTGSDPYRYPDVDWADEILQNSLSSQTNFSISGGAPKVKYFVNIGYQYQGGLYRTEKNEWNENYNPKFERKLYNFRSNVDVNFDDSFSLGLTLYGGIEDRNYPNVSAANMFGQFISRIPPNAMVIKYPTGYYGRHSSSYANPIGYINASGFSEEFNSSLSGMLNVTKELNSVLEGLSIKGNASFDGYFKNTFQRKMKVPYALYIEGDFDDQDSYSYDGAYEPLNKPTSTYRQNRDVWFDASVNYANTFGPHSVSALFLLNRQHRVLGGDIPYVSQGLVSRVTYSYDNRYFAEFNAGYNGTDNFHKDRRYGFFPAFSLGWVPIHDKEIIRFLKFRASYGLTGNDQIGGRRWLFIEEFQNGGGYSFGNNLNWMGGILEGPLANTLVTWEKAKRFNFGVELKLFPKELLTMNLDIFHESRKDMLITPGTVPYMSGVSVDNLPPLNNGKTSNKGFELELGHRYSINKDFSYFINGNISYARNKLKAMDEEDHRYPNLFRTGHRIGQQFGLVAIGFFKDQEDIINSRPQNFGKVIPGDVKYLDVNEDGVIDNNDVTAIGYSDVPEITFGISAGANWKGFDFSVLFQGAANFSVMREREAAWEFFNGGKVMEMHLDRWTPETASTAKYPVLHTGFNDNNHRASTLYLRKGDYLRLKNLEIGYTLKGLYLSKNYTISSVRFYVSGMNLFTWDKSEGDFDPETSGGRYWSYPQVRVFNFGLSLNI